MVVRLSHILETSNGFKHVNPGSLSSIPDTPIEVCVCCTLIHVYTKKPSFMSIILIPDVQL
jgi:hypothetical protein